MNISHKQLKMLATFFGACIPVPLSASQVELFEESEGNLKRSSSRSSSFSGDDDSEKETNLTAYYKRKNSEYKRKLEMGEFKSIATIISMYKFAPQSKEWYQDALNLLCNIKDNGSGKYAHLITSELLSKLASHAADEGGQQDNA